MKKLLPILIFLAACFSLMADPVYHGVFIGDVSRTTNYPVAKTSVPGTVYPDNLTVFVDNTGKLSAINGGTTGVTSLNGFTGALTGFLTNGQLGTVSFQGPVISTNNIVLNVPPPSPHNGFIWNTADSMGLYYSTGNTLEIQAANSDRINLNVSGGVLAQSYFNLSALVNAPFLFGDSQGNIVAGGSLPPNSLPPSIVALGTNAPPNTIPANSTASFGPFLPVGNVTITNLTLVGGLVSDSFIRSPTLVNAPFLFADGSGNISVGSFLPASALPTSIGGLGTNAPPYTLAANSTGSFGPWLPNGNVTISNLTLLLDLSVFGNSTIVGNETITGNEFIATSLYVTNDLFALKDIVGSGSITLPAGQVYVVSAGAGMSSTITGTYPNQIQRLDVTAGAGAGLTNVVAGSTTSILVGAPNAGTTSTTGGNDTALGALAAASLSSGSDNTMIGFSAGDFINTGSRNTAIGSASFGTTGSSSDNTGVGYEALTASTGSQETAVGSQAGGTLKGVGNVALGYQALFFNGGSTGPSAYNTGVGWQAGYYATNGTNNVYIGANLFPVGTYGSETNVTRIGNPATVTAYIYGALQGLTVGASGIVTPSIQNSGVASALVGSDASGNERVVSLSGASYNASTGLLTVNPSGVTAGTNINIASGVVSAYNVLPVFNIVDYGGKADDNFDNGTIINDGSPMWTQMKAVGGGRLYLPVALNYYKFDTPIIGPTNSSGAAFPFEVFGDGMSATDIDFHPPAGNTNQGFLCTYFSGLGEAHFHGFAIENSTSGDQSPMIFINSQITEWDHIKFLSWASGQFTNVICGGTNYQRQSSVGNSQTNDSFGAYKTRGHDNLYTATACAVLERTQCNGVNCSHDYVLSGSGLAPFIVAGSSSGQCQYDSFDTEIIEMVNFTFGFYMVSAKFCQTFNCHMDDSGAGVVAGICYSKTNWYPFGFANGGYNHSEGNSLDVAKPMMLDQEASLGSTVSSQDEASVWGGRQDESVGGLYIGATINANVALNAIVTTTTNGLISKANNATAPVTISVGASPFTYSNASTNNQNVFIGGGIVTAISVNGGVVGTGLTLTGVTTIPVQVGQTITVTYSSAPTMKWTAL